MIWCNPMVTQADEIILKQADNIWEDIGMDLPEEYVYVVDDDDTLATATTPNASYEGDPEAVWVMMIINYGQATKGWYLIGIAERNHDYDNDR